MPYRNLLLYFLLLTLLSTLACKKKEEDEPVLIDTILYPNFSHLDKGNYWVYEVYRVEPSGIAKSTGDMDSCYIGDDTTIRGVKWHWYMTSPTEGTLLRDSLHYIVDLSGAIQFSYIDYMNTLHRSHFLDPDHLITDVDTVALIEQKMTDRFQSITVPAGTFYTSSFTSTWTLNDTLVAKGFQSPRIQKTRYATEIGIVSQTLAFYLFDPNYTERRLIRYKVK